MLNVKAYFFKYHNRNKNKCTYTVHIYASSHDYKHLTQTDHVESTEKKKGNLSQLLGGE